MRSNRGTIETMAASGMLWSGEMVLDIRTLLFKSLRSARRSITISAFSMGNETDDLKEFFKIISDKLFAEKKILIIANDDENLKKYSRDMLSFLSEKYKHHLTLRFFDPKRKKDNMILHSKLTIIDRKYALVGSANISKNALEHNYEIMLKISGQSVSIMDDMMIKLSNAIKSGDDY